MEAHHDLPLPAVACRRPVYRAGGLRDRAACGSRCEAVLRHESGARSARYAPAARVRWPALPSQPATFYFGAVNGGVWKTTDAGATWQSLWDGQSSGSIGAIAVAESRSECGLRRQRRGPCPARSVHWRRGVYKSTDAGKTWTNLGLHDGQQIGGLAIDPKNAERVFVAVTGHPYGPQPGARPVPNDRRWQDVQARAVRE